MPDISMPQVGLNQPQIGATFCQVVPAGVPEAMRMNVEQAEPSTIRHPVKHQLDCPRREWPTTLRAKNKIASLGTFPQQSSQRPNFYPAQLVITRVATLGPFHVEDPSIQVELVPAGRESFLDSQPVGEQNQYQSGIPVAPASLARSVNKLGDLIGQQVLTAARSPARIDDCSLYGDWNHIPHSDQPPMFATVPVMLLFAKGAEREQWQSF
jgi:hypothetical protein